METIKLEYVDVFDGKEKKQLIFSRNLLKEPFLEKSLFANLVDGESMEPVINDKAVVVSDLSNKELVDDAVYLVYHGEKMWIKKYDLKEKIFFSINPKFSHLVYKESDVHIVAKVVLTFTNL